MDNITIELEGITIAPVNVAAMVNYYNEVFTANLEPFAAFGTTLYRGQLAGLRLIFCPNDFLNIEAEKNRQQFSFTVSDVKAMVEKSISAGGQGDVHEHEQGISGTLHDPDGNSIELNQRR